MDSVNRVFDIVTGEYTDVPYIPVDLEPVSPFKPIEPAPFWFAAYAMLQLKKEDVLAAIEDPDARYLAELDINTRKTYLRHDDMVVKLSEMNGFTSEQMDSLWLHVQDNYS